MSNTDLITFKITNKADIDSGSTVIIEYISSQRILNLKKRGLILPPSVKNNDAKYLLFGEF